MLAIEHLVKEYRTLRAVDDVTLQVNPGEIVGLLGPNGAGKTTLMRCACSILLPTAGRISINGHDLATAPEKAKQGLAFVPEVPNLYDLLTVDEHLKFIAMCFNTLDVYEKEGDRLLARFNLMDKKRELVSGLSKGMKQKLSLACALVHNADTFLFDEPMIGIDPAGVAEFKTMLHQGREDGHSYLISTHLLDTAEKICDRIIIMAKGRKIIDGTVAELRDKAEMIKGDLESVFLSLTQPADEAPPLPL